MSAAPRVHRDWGAQTWQETRFSFLFFTRRQRFDLWGGAQLAVGTTLVFSLDSARA